MEYPYLLMDSLQAARFRDETAGDEHRLEPIEIFSGKHKGKWALAERNMNNPVYADRRDAFLMLGNPVVLDSSVFIDPDAITDEEA